MILATNEVVYIMNKKVLPSYALGT